jgi:hypothetical protein
MVTSCGTRNVDSSSCRFFVAAKRKGRYNLIWFIIQGRRFAMNTKVTKEQALRWAAQGLTVLAVLLAALAVNLYFKVDELETTLSQARAEADKEIGRAHV